MSIVPSMSREQFTFIAEVIKELPPQCKHIVAWRFARLLPATNKGFHMMKFLQACGVEAVKESERCK